MRLLTWISLILIVIVILSPIAWLFVLSIKPEAAIMSSPFGPFEPTFENYVAIFERFRLDVATQTSLLIVFIVLAITVPISTLAAYSLSRFPFRGAQWILIFLVFCRMMVPSILILPLFQVISILGLRDTIWGVVLGHLSWTLPFAILILHGFCEEMPRDVEEAAQLDGLGVWGIFWKIVFPLMAPGVGVASLFTFGTSWGEFLFAVAFSTVDVRTGPVQISLMTTQYKVWWGALAASGIYWSIPMMVMAILFNRYMTRGLRLGF